MKFVLKTFWYSSIPVFTFFIITAIAGFWRKWIYLPVFFIFFFWLGGLREIKAIIEYWGWTTSFYLPSKLLAWASLLMFVTAIAASISWIIEYVLQSKKR